MDQLERVTCPPEDGSGVTLPQTEQQFRTAIQKKLVAYKRQDQTKGLPGFNLKVDDVLRLRDSQNNRCAACNIELLWAHQPKDTQQFSVDRLNNDRSHAKGSVRLTCFECNRKKGLGFSTPEDAIRRKLRIREDDHHLLTDEYPRRAVL